MGHLNLTRCLYVVVNKDTEERDYQRIKFSKEQFKEGERTAFNIITSERAPPKMANASKNFFECKWCEFNGVCHKGDTPLKSCRTCIHWDIEEEGKFSCSNTLFINAIGDKNLSTDTQERACIHYALDEDSFDG